MLKKTITYTNYANVEVTEDFYFNLSKAELMEMELSTEGGLQERIEKIVKAKKTPEVMKMFKGIILAAYGEKSPDGRRFIKSEELSKAFTETEAYSELMMELIGDADKASAFIYGIVPNELADKAQKASLTHK